MTLLFGQDELDKATTTPPVQPLLVRVLRGGGRGGGGGGGGRTSRGGGGGDGSSSSNGEEEDYTTGWGIGVVVLLVVVAIGLGQWFRRFWCSKRQGPKTNKNQESDQPTDTMAAALEPQAQQERRRRRQDYASAYQAARQAVLGGEDDDDDDDIPNTEAPQPPLSVRNGLYKGTYHGAYGRLLTVTTHLVLDRTNNPTKTVTRNREAPHDTPPTHNHRVVWTLSGRGRDFWGSFEIVEGLVCPRTGCAYWVHASSEGRRVLTTGTFVVHNQKDSSSFRSCSTLTHASWISNQAVVQTSHPVSLVGIRQDSES